MIVQCQKQDEGLFITEDQEFTSVLVRPDMSGAIYTKESWPEPVQTFENIADLIDEWEASMVHMPNDISIQAAKQGLIETYGGYK